MARRQIPVHDSMNAPRRPGILEALADKLGVDHQPEEEAREDLDGPDNTAGLPAAGQLDADEPAGPLVVDLSSEEIAETDEEQARQATKRTAKAQTAPAQTPRTESVVIDARIVAAKGKQALYVRLPREMHEFLSDLSYRLSKTNRDASMTNLVAQAIADKYPDALEATEDTQ